MWKYSVLRFILGMSTCPLFTLLLWCLAKIIPGSEWSIDLGSAWYFPLWSLLVGTVLYINERVSKIIVLHAIVPISYFMITHRVVYILFEITEFALSLLFLSFVLSPLHVAFLVLIIIYSLTWVGSALINEEESKN